MVLEGVIVNGRVDLKVPAEWPNGSRVTIELAADDLDYSEGYDPPPEEESHEEFLESLRQAVADIKAGIRGIPLEEAFAQIAAEFNLPPVPPE